MSGCGGCAYRGRSTAVESTFVGVRLVGEQRLTLCATEGLSLARGETVVVDLDGESAFGEVEQSPASIFKPCQKASARRILRKATEEDRRARQRQAEREEQARRFVIQRSRELGLEIKVSRVKFPLQGRQATVYFTAESRVDFRQLVRDTARRFGARIQMNHVGARDEAAFLGGIGICGRTLCCSTWLDKFQPISIQMAKRQNLSLNPSKISGQCGRLLCCLAYEDDQYRSGLVPKVRLPVITEDA